MHGPGLGKRLGPAVSSLRGAWKGPAAAEHEVRLPDSLVVPPSSLVGKPPPSQRNNSVKHREICEICLLVQ